jgi:TPR repeat protein
LKAAADRGLLEAQRTLSLLLEMPTSPAGQDMEASTKYLRLAAEQCHVPSMYRLGVRLLETAPAEGVGLLKQAADFGMPAACLEYAWQLCRGHGTAKDARAARRYLDAAASSKVPIILFTAGRALLEGSVFDRDADSGMKMVSEAAELGLAEAEAFAGDLCLERGEVARGEELLSRAASGGHLGARLYCGLRAIRRGDVSGKDSVRELASAGYVPAQRELGLVLLGKDAGSVEGKRLLQDAAKAGDTDAQFRVAMMMMEGPAAEKDLKLIEQYISNALDGTDIRALATYVGWLDDGKLGANRQADATKVLEDQIAKGNPVALFTLGVRYESGVGCVADPQKAAQLCKRAADMGLAVAQLEFGSYALKGTGIQQNDAVGFKYVKMALDNGLTEATGVLGWLYLKGIGTQKDEQKGFELTQLAAKDGGANELFNLATCYAHGWGTKIDPELAIKYLRQAAEAGSDLAKQALDALKDTH